MFSASCPLDMPKRFATRPTEMWPLESRNVATRWPPLGFVCVGAAAAIERMLTLVFVFEATAVEPPLVLREPTRVGPPVGAPKPRLLVVDISATPFARFIWHSMWDSARSPGNGNGAILF